MSLIALPSTRLILLPVQTALTDPTSLGTRGLTIDPQGHFEVQGKKGPPKLWGVGRLVEGDAADALASGTPVALTSVFQRARNGTTPQPCTFPFPEQPMPSKAAMLVANASAVVDGMVRYLHAQFAPPEVATAHGLDEIWPIPEGKILGLHGPFWATIAVGWEIPRVTVPKQRFLIGVGAVETSPPQLVPAIPDGVTGFVIPGADEVMPALPAMFGLSLNWLVSEVGTES